MLRAATEGDRDAVRRWRNHPNVRQACFTTHEISEREHDAWWPRALSPDSGPLLLIHEYNGVPCGVVTFTDHDSEAASATWAFYLDVDGLNERGELYDAWRALEQEALDHAFGPLRLQVLNAEVFAWNKGVLRLHRRCGFTDTGRYTRDVDGTPQDVIRIALRRADRVAVPV